MQGKLWNIDTTHSGIHFSVRHMVIAKVRGRFSEWSGAIYPDESAPDDLTRARTVAEIDAASIDTGVADRDSHLRSADFFDTERFPAIRFESEKVERDEGERYKVHGKLTIRDVTRDVVLEVEHGGQTVDPWGNQRVAFTAKTSVDRGDFGLTWNQVLEAGGVVVGDRVDIEIELQAVQVAASAA